jgi:uncharacterized LabA/DUF88 family protein
MITVECIKNTKDYTGDITTFEKGQTYEAYEKMSSSHNYDGTMIGKSVLLLFAKAIDGVEEVIGFSQPFTENFRILDTILN